MGNWIIRFCAVFSVCVLTVYSPTTRGAQTLEQEMTLVLGQQRVMDASAVDSFSESTRGIIEVKIPRDGKKMVITAVRPGTTSLLLIERSGKQKTIFITVFSRSPKVIEDELKQLLVTMPNLDISQVGPRLFINGSVPSDIHADKVEQVTNLYKGQVASLVQVDPSAVLQRTNIRLDMIFVELRASDNNNYGVSWPGSYGGGGIDGQLDLLTGNLSASYQVMNQAMPALEAAARHGWVKIHKKVTVMTTPGNSAKYESGGEINVAVAGSQAAELRAVPYGARLTVEPRYDEKNATIDLKVDAEVSELAETNQNVPGRTISRVQTIVHLGLGQSIMLGGLDSQVKGRTKTGLPLLSRIPILGFFFGSTDSKEEQSQGLIIITPTVLDNPDPQSKRELEKALENFENFKGKFEDI